MAMLRAFLRDLSLLLPCSVPPNKVNFADIRWIVFPVSLPQMLSETTRNSGCPRLILLGRDSGTTRKPSCQVVASLKFHATYKRRQQLHWSHIWILYISFPRGFLWPIIESRTSSPSGCTSIMRGSGSKPPVCLIGTSEPAPRNCLEKTAIS